MSGVRADKRRRSASPEADDKEAKSLRIGKQAAVFYQDVVWLMAETNSFSAEAILRAVDKPSSSAQTIPMQQKLVEEGALLCYRSDQHVLPMALLNPVFGKFGLAVRDKSSVELRDILFCVDLCRAMQPLTKLEATRQESFGALLQIYLKDSLPDTVRMVPQTRFQSIVDIRIQAKVSSATLLGATRRICKTRSDACFASLHGIAQVCWTMQHQVA